MLTALLLMLGSAARVESGTHSKSHELQVFYEASLDTRAYKRSTPSSKVRKLINNTNDHDTPDNSKTYTY